MGHEHDHFAYLQQIKKQSEKRENKFSLTKATFSKAKSLFSKDSPSPVAPRTPANTPTKEVAKSPYIQQKRQQHNMSASVAKLPENVRNQAVDIAKSAYIQHKRQQSKSPTISAFEKAPEKAAKLIQDNQPQQKSTSLNKGNDKLGNVPKSPTPHDYIARKRQAIRQYQDQRLKLKSPYPTR